MRGRLVTIFMMGLISEMGTAQTPIIRTDPNTPFLASFEVNGTNMSPDAPVPISLESFNGANIFSINGQNSGYWRFRTSPAPASAQIQYGSPTPTDRFPNQYPTKTIVTYDLYINAGDPAHPEEVLCLRFSADATYQLNKFKIESMRGANSTYYDTMTPYAIPVGPQSMPAEGYNAIGFFRDVNGPIDTEGLNFANALDGTPVSISNFQFKY